MKADQITVKQMIDALSKMNPNAIIEISVSVYTSVYPIAYVNPTQSSYSDDFKLQSPNENLVRISASLPYDDKTYMTVQTRKIK